jgi:hypothetical protein
MKNFVSIAIRTSLALSFATTAFGQNYSQVNLVSNTSGVAPVTDPTLVNPWGLSRSSSSPWWVSDNGTGLSTLYNGAGTKQGLIVTIPKADQQQNLSHRHSHRNHLQRRCNGFYYLRQTGNLPLRHA